MRNTFQLGKRNGTHAKIKVGRIRPKRKIYRNLVYLWVSCRNYKVKLGLNNKELCMSSNNLNFCLFLSRHRRNTAFALTA